MQLLSLEKQWPFIIFTIKMSSHSALQADSLPVRAAFTPAEERRCRHEARLLSEADATSADDAHALRGEQHRLPRSAAEDVAFARSEPSPIPAELAAAVGVRSDAAAPLPPDPALQTPQVSSWAYEHAFSIHASCCANCAFNVASSSTPVHALSAIAGVGIINK